MSPPRSTPRWPLSRQLLLVIVSFLALATLLNGLVQRNVQQDQFVRQMERYSQRTFRLLSASAIDAMIVEDRPVLQSIVDQIAENDSALVEIRLANRKGQELASWGRPGGGGSKSLQKYTAPVDFENESFGEASITWDTSDDLARIRWNVLQSILLTTGVLGLLLFALLFGLRRLVTAPLQLISDKLQCLSNNEPIPENIPAASSSQEWLSLDASVTELAEATRARDERTRELVAARNELEATNQALGIARDQALETSRLKSSFLTSMSHELRTPLNAVLGMSEALQEGVYGAITEDQKVPVSHVQTSGRHLLNLINEILDLSKIEANQMKLSPAVIETAYICRESMQFVMQQARRKDIRIELNLDPAAEYVRADHLRLKQVLVNLLDNAVKFTPKGGVVGINSACEPEVGTLSLTVWDTGIGIAEEDQAKLFQPFRQLDSGLTRNYAGTGLGLSLVKSMIELHEGSVSLISQPGVGSRFTVTLPWDSGLRPEGAPSEKTEQEAPGDPQHSTATALSIEDSAAAAETLTRYLTELGVESHIHQRGAGAVERAKSIQPDIILLDILMPDTSGWNILESLRTDPETAEVPVLVISALDKPENIGDYPINGYLRKPYSREDLQSALREAGIEWAGEATRSALAVVPAEREGDEPDQAGPDQTSILIVEDNEANITILYDYLKAKQYHVMVARNGREGLETLETNRPDLILMDIQMPEMGGLEAIERIRANPETRPIPIIALTAHAMKSDEDACRAAGATAYFSKPVRLRELEQEIQRILQLQGATP